MSLVFSGTVLSPQFMMSCSKTGKKSKKKRIFSTLIVTSQLDGNFQTLYYLKGTYELDQLIKCPLHRTSLVPINLSVVHS